MNKGFHFIGNFLFYNCRDCGRELWHEEDRKLGLCMNCLEARLRFALPKRCKTLIIPRPTANVMWN